MNRYCRLASSAFLIAVVFLFPGVSLFAQSEDPAGMWLWHPDEDRMERGPGPELGDYLGYPINDAARYAADNWDPSIVGVPESQCRGASADHSWRDPTLVTIIKEIDVASQQVADYRTHILYLGPEQVIYMDGRPHPPDYARHSWQGFSTGRWERGILTVKTDHLKTNLLRWNGIPRSDKATLSWHFLRHGDVLTVALAIYDPLYLTEPMMETLDYVFTPDRLMVPFPCEAVSEVDRPDAAVPSRMPGTNKFLNEFPARYGVPPEAARGGAETMYPEYIAKMKTMKKLPRIATKRVGGL